MQQEKKQKAIGRPIDRFYKCWLEDKNNGVLLNRCRGINHRQYITADKISRSYYKAFACDNYSINKLRSNVNFVEDYVLYRVDTRAHYLHEHKRVFLKLQKKSQAIITHICLLELPLRKYESLQKSGWSRDDTMSCLRIALDELAEIYTNLPQIQKSKNTNF